MPEDWLTALALLARLCGMGWRALAASVARCLAGPRAKAPRPGAIGASS